MPAPTLPPTWPADAPPAFHLMAKPTGAICNLDCTYCFFLSKELLYPGDRFRMSDEVLEAYVRQTIEAHRTPEVTIAFQGGEPTLMGVAFFERTLELIHDVAGDRPVEVTIQTNGTLLDDAWCELLARHRVLVGLSMDGPEAMHDAFRVDKRGGPTHARVLEAWHLLQRHGVDTNVLCTVHSANGDHGGEVYRWFRDELGVRFLQLIPIVERVSATNVAIADEGWGDRARDRPLYVQAGDQVTSRSVHPEQWGRFLIEVFDEWVRHDVGEVFVPTFDAALAAWLGMEPSMCIFRSECGTALALEHNGDVYSCDHYVEPDHLLGNLLETHLVDLVASPQQVAFGRAKADLPGQCLRCDVRFACNGECPRNRFATTDDGEPGLNVLCAGYLAFFHHIDGPMRTMADLLRRNDAPSKIVGLLADEEAARFRDAGRNDPCPCGSGAKYKHCHGA